MSSGAKSSLGHQCSLVNHPLTAEPSRHTASIGEPSRLPDRSTRRLARGARPLRGQGASIREGSLLTLTVTRAPSGICPPTTPRFSSRSVTLITVLTFWWTNLRSCAPFTMGEASERSRELRAAMPLLSYPPSLAICCSLGTRNVSAALVPADGGWRSYTQAAPGSKLLPLGREGPKADLEASLGYTSVVLYQYLHADSFGAHPSTALPQRGWSGAKGSTRTAGGKTFWRGVHG